jgi:crossover junction endodeoxyribonuclease RuvC
LIQKCSGVDIGVTGGIAVLSASGELIEVHEMPCLADGHAGRRAVNGPLLASIVFASHATRAFVEHVSARPGEGAVGAFAFGRSRVVSSKAFWPPPASAANS